MALVIRGLLSTNRVCWLLDVGIFFVGLFDVENLERVNVSGEVHLFLLMWCAVSTFSPDYDDGDETSVYIFLLLGWFAISSIPGSLLILSPFKECLFIQKFINSVFLLESYVMLPLCACLLRPSSCLCLITFEHLIVDLALVISWTI